jgi:hypothetical protein
MYLNYGNAFCSANVGEPVRSYRKKQHFENSIIQLRHEIVVGLQDKNFGCPMTTSTLLVTLFFFIIPAHRKKRKNYSAKGLNLCKIFRLISPVASNVF